MAPEGGPIKLPRWNDPDTRPGVEKKRGELSPTVFFLPAYIIARGLGLVDEDGYEKD